jgi:hypothetical protein
VNAADPPGLARLRFLGETVAAEAAHLAGTDGRLFASPFTEARARSMASDADLSERVDAFVARFGRLQDTLGDKLLPALLAQLAEPVGSAIDNLERAERLGFVASADLWLQARRLRNRMVHEYVRDPAALAAALEAGHAFVPLLMQTAAAFGAELKRRFGEA